MEPVLERLDNLFGAKKGKVLGCLLPSSCFFVPGSGLQRRLFINDAVVRP